jgi:GcrA cell cycle regulator
MEWNAETIERLRGLWAEGYSTAEIGRRMGISKNAVVGKAHRLNLPSRPSPIRREPGGRSSRPPQPRRVTGPTLPPLATAGGPAGNVPEAVEPAPVTAVEAVLREPVLREPVVRNTPRPAWRSTRPLTCSWPLGEPGTASFRFCDDDALPGKPYCDRHAAIAYVKVRDRRDEAAA